MFAPSRLPTPYGSFLCSPECLLCIQSSPHVPSPLLHPQVGKGRVVKITGIQNKGRTATVLLRGSNKMVLEVGCCVVY